MSFGRFVGEKSEYRIWEMRYVDMNLSRITWEMENASEKTRRSGKVKLSTPAGYRLYAPQ